MCLLSVLWLLLVDPQFFLANFFCKFRGTVCQILQLTATSCLLSKLANVRGYLKYEKTPGTKCSVVILSSLSSTLNTAFG